MSVARKMRVSAPKEPKVVRSQEVDESEGPDQLVDDLATNHKVATMYSELDGYLRPLLRYPTLKKQTQYAPLWVAYKNGTPTEQRNARDIIVYGNTKLVLKIALRRRNHGLPLLDLIQEGMIGCMRAIETFDPEKGFHFSTYATNWIRQAIGRAIQDKGEKDPYRTPVHEADLIQFIHKVYVELCLKKARPPKELEVFQEIKTRKTKIVEKIKLADVVRIVRGMFTGKAVRLDAPAAGLNGEAGDETILDRLNVGPAKTETIIEARRLYAEYQQAMTRIEEAVDALPPRTAQVLRLRFGLGEFDRQTLEEIGERYEVTRERIRQIEAKGLEELHAKLGITGPEIEEIVDVTEELEVIIHA